MKSKLTLILLSIILLLAGFLRFYHLNTNPPSPYWEEAALGYDAYSILKTGKDFHGNLLPLVAFESFGDYKPSLYFYATVPSVAVFGLNTFAVRFPSAFFGTLTVLLIFLLTKVLFKSSSVNLTAAFLLAISPWHLQFSRVGFEANLGLFFVCLGAWLILKNKHYFGAVAFALSMYTYHAYRVFVPLFLIVFFLINRQKKAFLTGILVALLALPIFLNLNSPIIKQRFAETSAFTSLEPIIKSNQLIAEDGGGTIAKFIHHRYWQYSQIFLKNYFDHFNFNYLFMSGDSNPRHSTQAVGYLYLIQLPFLIYGLLLSLKKPTFSSKVLLLWLLLAPVPAALTLASPHGLRSLSLLIPLTIFTAYGISQFKRFVLYLALIIVLIESSRYLYIYHQRYPSQYASFWQSGYQEMIQTVSDKQDNYDQVYITRQLGRPSIYYWFYTQTDPHLVQALNNSVPKDQGEYLEFGKIKFQDNNYLPNSLIVTAEAGAFKIYEN